ncbi:MAG: asparaginase [Bacteroidales bacterium]|jgi:L-asparaginase
MKTKNKPATLLIIYTGGTIGMVEDSVNGSLRPFSFENILDEIPELIHSGYRLCSYSFEPLLDSSNITPEVWIRIAMLIKEHYNGFDGFIVLHGTDTMVYTASALSFLLENLKKPVILTGSQLPVSSLRSDAKENLMSSIEIAGDIRNGKPVVTEVAIFFQDKLFRGNRTTKFNADEFKAFQSFNYPPLAESGVHLRYNNLAIGDFSSDNNLIVHKNLNRDVAILKIFPGITKKVVQSVLNIEGLRGVILETFGAGNAPNEKWFLSEIENAIKKGVIIVGVTQCAEGSVEMGMYETSIALEKLGVVSGHDITTEAALTKLMFLLGMLSSKQEIGRQLNRSLRGEITI